MDDQVERSFFQLSRNLTKIVCPIVVTVLGRKAKIRMRKGRKKVSNPLMAGKIRLQAPKDQADENGV